MNNLYKNILSKKLKRNLLPDFFFTTKFKIVIILLSILLGALRSNLMAQDSLTTLNPGIVADIFNANPKVLLGSVYHLEDSNTTHLKMSYGGYKVLNKESWPERVINRRPIEVDVVMTLHPSDTLKWKEDFYELIKNRVVALQDLDSAFLIDKFIKWNIYLQDDKSSYNGAKKQFHGIVVHYLPLHKKNQQDHYASLLRKWDEKRQIKIAGNKLNKIIDRNNGKWKNMLVITDCSGSMMPYGTEVVLWHLLKHDKKNISQFVFFNDGDPNQNKTIGNAGGVYVYETKRSDKVIKAVKLFTEKGFPYNNDNPENDAEAIIKGSQMVKQFDDIVLIADNQSGVRDISLANKIKKPVRIVLCGVNNGIIHPDYIKLAYETNGSIHTIEEDIDQFMKTKYGQIIAIDNVKFKVEEDQLVQVTKKIKVKR
jgi:hypothetical protein